jgi:hypothetical protein
VHHNGTTTKTIYVESEVLTAASMKMAVFWVVVLCSLAEVYKRFRGTCCLHYQGDHLHDGGSKYLEADINTYIYFPKCPCKESGRNMTRVKICKRN